VCTDKPKLVVGLTGGIATGKSTVSSLLKASHIPIVDADIIAREVVAPGTPALKQIEQTFGAEILKEDGTLDRPKLGSIIFSDPKARAKLNAIVHPAVRRGMFWAVVGHWWAGEKLCVMDVPLLIESKLYPYVGRVVVVYW
jgi:dephospho-CoA kinase